MARESGILAAVSSLPSPYGIGTMGRAAYGFADFLERAGQKVWQVLPLGPTGFGDSPYQTFSTFAGNPYLIDLDLLAEKGLLTKEEIGSVPWGDDPAHVDYGRIYEGRFPLLRLAARRFFDSGAEREAFRAFRERESAWLDDYALFMAIKDRMGGAGFPDWPEELRLRDADALRTAERELSETADEYRFMQYEFFSQWRALKAYVNGKGISVLGDVPIYVSLDSSDVWAEPDAFRLDGNRRPQLVAGVPPDYFTADGQLWGNPLYDWDRMAENGYAWWLRRLSKAGEMYDRVRLDHFRGLESYWAVPAGEKTAKNGSWMPGPGKPFIRTLHEKLPGLPVIAEDLGFLTPEVEELLAYSGYPGMKVLQFAFDADEPSAYLPYLYDRNCVCYTGTHDNDTLASWIVAADGKTIARAREYFGIGEEDDLIAAMLRGGAASVADLFIAQIQDHLGLGADSRMNTPGIGRGNWTWRLLPGQASDGLADRIAGMTRTYGR